MLQSLLISFGCVTIGLIIGWMISRSVSRTPLTPAQAKQSLITMSAGAFMFSMLPFLSRPFDSIGAAQVVFTLGIYIPIFAVLMSRSFAK